ncbi:TonB-dependent outer membrane receptor, SusC/RagA subfamily, signature region [Pedobacter sp. ok626]|uniref:alpha-2-macroglobulin family protein n=1 Tax=Pedobacter sp. ok626 TaxID=1761882 RepID=UPI00088F627D|nr:carboxypeptidase-like regulatory domain-containing protein [Pedobacter sp. ok626]SDK38156.1 TonB-dependent outer membrane receptor, SusC/RagA subfamily, signature region [Pedobacter sp. ok626]
MKHLLRSALLIICATTSLFAQKKLTNSRTAGSYTYIYKLTDKEAFSIASTTKMALNDGFLHTLVDSFYNVKNSNYLKKLPYGNYLEVKAVKNALVYKLFAKNNVNLQFINNRKDFQFTVTDLKGNEIPNASVKTGKRKKVKYNRQAKLYVKSSVAKNTVITVNHDGINNYFNAEERDEYRPYRPSKKASFFKRIFSPEGKRSVKSVKQKYTGYMVFNKPMYKPLDTVKFKAYLANANGKTLRNKPLRVELQKGGNDGGLVLTTLMPYNEGGYEYSFVLADSLQLTLDRSYNIVLKEAGKKDWTTIFRGYFRYEDYELKSVNFAVRTDREEHSPGSPVTVFLKATDENDLAVPDGRVEVFVRANSPIKYYSSHVFVKDTLWKTSVILDPVGETKMVLPDSIFPKADLNFSMSFSFLNSNNEHKTAYKSLKYVLKDKEIKTEFIKDSLKIDYLIKGKSTKQKAVIKLSYPFGDDEDSVTVELPAKIKMHYKGDAYEVKTADGYVDHIYLEDLQPELSVAAKQNKDSLTIAVSNVHKIPFWYTVFSGDEVFLKGYTTSLDTVIRHKGTKAAHIKLNYVWAEKDLSAEASAFYASNSLNVKLLAPDLVYPGQTVNMAVKVTDANNQPVAGTDVTAYAYTTKFKNSHPVSPPYFGKPFFARTLKSAFEAEILSLSGEMKLTWDRWGKELNLDTIEYYRFTQAKELYAINEDTNEPDTAIVAPFVIKNGAIEPVHVIYIDGVPVYFSQTNQLQRYAFRLSPGEHDIRMRTAGYTIHLPGYHLMKGKKTIISVVADVSNTKANVSIAPNELSLAESDFLTKYMMRIENNFNGNKATIKAGNNTQLLDLPVLGQGFTGFAARANAGTSLLIGPFAENFLEFKSGEIQQNFIKEPGYSYTFLPGLLKQKSYSTAYGFNRILINSGSTDDYKQYPFKSGETDSIWNEYLDLRSRTTQLFNMSYRSGKNYGKLIMTLDTSISKHMPYLKNIIIYKYDEPDFVQIYHGNTSYFSDLESNEYRIIYLFKDNRYFVAERVVIKPAGVNYFEWKGMRINPADNMSQKIDEQIKSVRTGSNNTLADVQRNVLEKINDKYFDPAILTGKMTGRVIDAESKEALPGVSVKLKGASYATFTGADGHFSLKVPHLGKLIIAYIGYDSKEIVIKNGDVGDIKLDAATSSLNEVVVVGYGTQKKSVLTGSVQSVSVDALAGRVAGVSVNGDPSGDLKVMIRGTNSLTGDNKPLIIVDGLPYNGDVGKLDANSIVSMDILKGSDASAIYGARGANGVIVIKTKGGNTSLLASGELAQRQETFRTNFSDYAIWQPKLLTDAEGKATFTVKFPDDITNWNTQLIAMNGRKQSGVGQTNIKSFKTLSANFVSPSFALAGDSINVIGKLMNYNNIDETVTRKFSYNGAALLNSSVTFKNAKIDTVGIVAKGGGFKVHADHVNVVDSLKFEYTMKQDNGYFDGEIRKIPLLQAGVIETKGYFNALTRDTTVSYNFDAALGKVTLRAEASLFPTLLDEIDKLRTYEYLCNEQLASKLKALLLEKSVRKYLSEPFKEEKNIKEILKKLQNNRRPEGTWGWWRNSNEELWISLHIVEALLEAQKQGYPVVLDKDKLYRYLTSKMASDKYFDQIYGIRLLSLLNEKYYANDWIIAIEKQRTELEEKNVRERKANSDVPKLAAQPLYEKLQLMQLKQKAGMPIDLKWLLGLKNETMFGNSYWGEEGRYFWDNSIQNTLLAYQILKANGNYRDELDRITRYFLEQRKSGQWRNTFESSLILETILPELMNTSGKKPQPATLVFNQTEQVSIFPFNKVIDPGALKLNKKGDAPVYFTAYQQFNNPKPEKVSKDFTVRTSFEQNRSPVQKLKPGTLATLRVDVDVRADADYVMIEIPIPAGCSYENKIQSFWGIETHREYFKHKTSIFCTKLKKGTYTFTVQLMPRYAGNYILNPAKAEMMYFPVFYGREGMKRVAIK